MADDTLDLDFVQGETFIRELTFADDGVAGSFTGWDIQAQVREKEDITSVLILDLGSYFTVSPDGAKATLRVPATVTAQLTSKALRVNEWNAGAYWDMFLVDPLDPTNASLFMEGRATVNAAATKTEAPA